MLHAEFCVHCGKPNQYYDSSLEGKIDPQIDANFIAKLQAIYQTESENAIETAQKKTMTEVDNTEEEKKQEVFETKWKCWRCKKIYSMD